LEKIARIREGARHFASTGKFSTLAHHLRSNKNQVLHSGSRKVLRALARGPDAASPTTVRGLLSTRLDEESKRDVEDVLRPVELFLEVPATSWESLLKQFQDIERLGGGHVEISRCCESMSNFLRDKNSLEDPTVIEEIMTRFPKWLKLFWIDASSSLEEWSAHKDATCRILHAIGLVAKTNCSDIIISTGTFNQLCELVAVGPPPPTAKETDVASSSSRKIRRREVLYELPEWETFVLASNALRDFLVCSATKKSSHLSSIVKMTSSFLVRLLDALRIRVQL